MSRTDRVVRGVIASYAATALTAVAGFVLVPIVLRFVTREEYGLWAAIGQAIGYLALLDLGVGSAVIRRAAQLGAREDGHRQASRTLSTAVAVYCGLSVVFLVVGALVTPLVPRVLAVPAGYRQLAVMLFAAMVVYGAASLPLRVSLKALFGFQHIARANLITLVENVASPTATVILLTAGVGLMALPLGAILAGLLAASTAFLMLRRLAPAIRIRWQDVSRDEARELFTWSWLLGLNSLAVVVIYQTDNLVVAWGSGLEAAAAYSLTSRLPLYAMPLIFALTDACLPGAIELCEQQKLDRVRDVHLRVLRVSIGAAAAAAIVAIFFNEPFMRLWVGDQNFGGMLLTVAFALILVYRVMMQSASMVVIGTGRVRGVVAMSAVEAALNLALSLWWVRRYGMTGVALATVVAGLSTSSWFVTRVVTQELRVNVWRYLWSGLARPLISAVPAVAAAALIRDVFPLRGWLDVFLAAAATGALYVLTFAWIGVPASDRAALFERLRISARRIRTGTQPLAMS